MARRITRRRAPLTRVSALQPVCKVPARYLRAVEAFQRRRVQVLRPASNSFSVNANEIFIHPCFCSPSVPPRLDLFGNRRAGVLRGLDHGENLDRLFQRAELPAVVKME